MYPVIVVLITSMLIDVENSVFSPQFCFVLFFSIRLVCFLEDVSKNHWENKSCIILQKPEIRKNYSIIKHSIKFALLAIFKVIIQ
jgi:hypothetical protein